MRWTVIALLIVAAGVLLFAGPRFLARPAPGPDAEVLHVEGRDFFFEPRELSVARGQPVRVVFTNAGNDRHNFVIRDLDVETDVQDSGERDVVTFTPRRSGTFRFVCTVPGHEAAGMFGEITVRDR